MHLGDEYQCNKQKSIKLFLTCKTYEEYVMECELAGIDVLVGKKSFETAHQISDKISAMNSLGGLTNF